ncbi:MAG: hypothetical protein MJ007_05905, partial [Paludibacteraceae bacterium]|nr:hypothetical protein [Paludibacteraceae bacterium]
TGLLRLGIKTTADVTVTKMVLTDNNSSAKLWGKFKVTAPSDGGLEYVEDGDNTLTVNLGSGVALNSSTYTYFFFCLPAGTLAGGFTVDMESANGDVAKIEYTSTDKVTELNIGKALNADDVMFLNPISVLNGFTQKEGIWSDPSSELNGFTNKSGAWN